MNATRENVLETINASIQEIKTALSAQVLDGTPWLVMARFRGATLEVLIFGEWERENGKHKGFIHQDAVPNSLCGACTFSAKSAKIIADKLNAESESGRTYGVIHSREFLGQRLSSLETTLSNLQRLMPAPIKLSSTSVECGETSLD